MAKEINGLDPKDTLGQIDNQTMLLQAFEQKAQMSLVLCGVGACNQDVVNVDKNVILESSAHLIHQSLECLGRILEAKRHSKKLKKAKRRDHCSLWYVSRSYWDLIVSPYEVDFGKDSFDLQAC